jgi:hypothetical protein
MSDGTNLDLTDQEMDDYLEVVYFAISKGTANVSPADKKKLRPLLRHYAKMKHPFAACVRDNRKRFGAHTEEYCAVLKDLIVGNTKWRGKGKKYTPKKLAETQEFNMFLTDVLEFENEVPEDFLEYLDQITEKDVEAITGMNIIAEEADFADGDVAWDYSKSMDHIRRELESALNEGYAQPENYGADAVAGQQYWVEDIQPGQALVCHAFTDYFVVPYKMNKNGVVLSDEADWTPVAKAWVEQNYAEEPQVLAEMYFADGDVVEEDGVIWKTIMREGVWKYSPGPGQRPVAKPITVTKSGISDPKKFVISLEELKKNFDAGAKDHITIPTSHDDKVHENTGFIEALRIGTDKDGRATLEAAHNFTEPDIKAKVKRGTIANVSAGILFDYINKETGTKFNAILGHSALTNSPWLNKMEPFRKAVNAGEDLEIISFSEEDEVGDMSNLDNTTAQNEGGVIVSTQEVETPKNTFFDDLGLSEDEVKERLNRLEAVEAEVRKNRIDAKLAAWKEEGKTPAVLTVAEEALLADSGAVAINLSENGKSSELTLSEVVERLVNASPSLKLDEEVVEEEKLAGEKPPADTSGENVDFSEDEKVEIGTLMFDHGMSEEAAIAKVRSARDSA